MKSKLLFSALFLAFIGFVQTSKAQDGSYAKNHPRRTEVNHRLEKQNNRIHDKVKDGEMSRSQAHQLHREDHRIRKEEQRMASRHNGHLTKHEQHKLNRQENHVSRQIHRA